MSITVSHSIGDLANDLRQAAELAPVLEAKAVRKVAIEGNKIAKAFAKESAGRHGKHYHKRFSAEAITALSWEYGPSGRPQGEMSFEHGSRNQPPHHDLARSADIVGPMLAEEAQDVVDKLFWP